MYTAGVQAVSVPGDDDRLMLSPSGLYSRREALQRTLLTPGGTAQQIALRSPRSFQQLREQQQQQCMSRAARVLQLPPLGQHAQTSADPITRMLLQTCQHIRQQQQSSILHPIRGFKTRQRLG